ncbi:MAG: serine hydrolase [Bacteroidales bacterium]|nr:serine hydrolase [Bacteroidales bacterium]
MMKYKTNLIIIIILIINCCKQANDDNQSLSRLDKEIDSIRIGYNIPAISYGVVKNDTIVLQKTIGVRDIEQDNKTETTDLFHIGANTKAFTAFMCAKQVEEGTISWETKFFDLYPELKNDSNKAYYCICLKDLLSHRARLIQFENDSEVYPIVDYEKKIDPWLSLTDKRYFFIKNILTYDPMPFYDNPDMRYSNAGYIAAALMLEKASGKTWEKLIEETSQDLNMTLHVGWPDNDNQNEPKGHIDPKRLNLDIEKEIIPMPYAIKKYHYFNQYLLLNGPSENLSISLPDFLEFLRLNVQGLNGKNNYLKAETYQQLFSSYPDYSYGWKHADYFIPCYYHKGSARTFDSVAIIVPEKQLGIVIMMNVAIDDAIDEIAELIINEYAT